MPVFGTVRLAKLLVVIALGTIVADAASIKAQTLKKEPDPKRLSCEEKVLVENNLSNGSNFRSYWQLPRLETDC